MQAEIAGMTQAEELAFWQNGTIQLQEQQTEKQTDQAKDGSSRNPPLAAFV